jgi:hypothetical protein
MSDSNFSVIIFKNNKKKKILKSFVSESRAIKFYEKKLKESRELLFTKEYENGKICEYKICLTHISCPIDRIYYIDELGRTKYTNTKISENLYIKKIDFYKKEEKIFDVKQNKKITFDEFKDRYLNKKSYLMISKLNNKVVVQEDLIFNLFSFKNEKDCERFLDILENYIEPKNFMVVRDFSSAQKKYLYDLLVDSGFKIDFLYRQSTTHPKEK